MEHIPESIEAIMARMGERYFAIPAADLVGAAQPTSPEASSARTNGTPPQASHETTTAPSPLFPGALADYIPAEVFLENMGFFTPSSKKIRGTYIKGKKVAEKIELDGTKRIIKVEVSAHHKLGLPNTLDLDYYHLCSHGRALLSQTTLASRPHAGVKKILALAQFQAIIADCNKWKKGKLPLSDCIDQSPWGEATNHKQESTM